MISLLTESDGALLAPATSAPATREHALVHAKPPLQAHILLQQFRGACYCNSAFRLAVAGLCSPACRDPAAAERQYFTLLGGTNSGARTPRWGTSQTWLTMAALVAAMDYDRGACTRHCRHSCSCRACHVRLLIYPAHLGAGRALCVGCGAATSPCAGASLQLGTPQPPTQSQ